MLLGCIGDDFTGSSDLANTLAKGGMRVVQYCGVPNKSATADVQAGVIALKSRSIPTADAVRQSLAALDWLQAEGCKQFFFKYCSTFDSTDAGNIGPVADALADALDARQVVVCPAFPGAGRSVYQGYLFVKDALLNESGMEDHPLTPMRDANLRRLMARQSSYPVGHITAETVFQGRAAIAAQMAAQDAVGNRMLIVDALRDADLIEIGAATRGLPLVTGGSGVALGLPANFGVTPAEAPWRPQAGKAAILSGSCSIATRKQIDHHLQRHPGYKIEPAQVISGKQTPTDVACWLMATRGLPIAYSSVDPADVRASQSALGKEAAAHALESFFGATAACLVELGIARILTAGGETSGAIVEALNIDTLEIGPEIDPGVPALRAGQSLVLALKSGNFGAVDYFTKADRILGGSHA